MTLTLSYIAALAVVGILLTSPVNCIFQQRYPNLMVNPEKCWTQNEPRPDDLRICDPDALISETQARELQRLAVQVKAETDCPCSSQSCHISRLSNRSSGYTVTMALVRTMGDNSDVILAAKSYAVYLRSPKRGFYDRVYNKCEEDILIFLSYEQKVVYILTGTAARVMVTDNEIKEIINNSENEFRASIFQGLSYVIDKIKQNLPKLIQN